ncbi:hypothetical protein [Nannocystis pusilla]|uniref:hypothetical protein n=1 Tax=Nannocystis pusilla TaxID=889268 RepID=UPI003B7C60A3
MPGLERAGAAEDSSGLGGHTAASRWAAEAARSVLALAKVWAGLRTAEPGVFDSVTSKR